jgi:hypothetical protein
VAPFIVELKVLTKTKIEQSKTTTTTTMAIERNLFFYNGNAYDITATMNFVTCLYKKSCEELFPEEKYDAIMSVLIDYKYLNIVDNETLIEDIHDPVYITVGQFFMRYGIVDHRVEYYIEQFGNDYLNTAHWVNNLINQPLGDFPVPEECIEDDEDDGRDEAMYMLAESMGRTQDLDELYAYGHVDGMTEAGLDSFLSDPDVENTRFLVVDDIPTLHDELAEDTDIDSEAEN